MRMEITLISQLLLFTQQIFEDLLLLELSETLLWISASSFVTKSITESYIVTRKPFSDLLVKDCIARQWELEVRILSFNCSSSVLSNTRWDQVSLEQRFERWWSIVWWKAGKQIFYKMQKMWLKKILRREWTGARFCGNEEVGPTGVEGEQKQEWKVNLYGARS